MPAKVLVIEDDETIVTMLEYNLKASGFEVVTAASSEEGELILSEQLVDLVILDWMLPDMSGIELCGRLRRTGKFPRIPIVMLTARGEEADRVRGFSNGADDYVVKPFSVPELMARVKALLRRSAPNRVSEILAVGDISLDREAHRVTRSTREISLGPTEYRLLEVLLESAGRVLSRNQLIDRVWGTTADIDERTIDVHVGRLRKALVRGNELDPIRTVRGAGYSFETMTKAS
ncbi:MAG TPA: phosphate regulon transcriptional regulator PhoB [Hyphomicrobium sp.]|nr:phosphate regulon transcriptional regulator PhoB [Hyphomicrobium sp.]